MSGTARPLVDAQYATSDNLARRVGVYRFLHEDTPLAGGFDSWVLDHHRWRGTETVLDLGCGPGPYVPALLGRARRVVATDLSVGMLGECRARAPAGAHVAVTAGDARHLPLASGSADVVLAAHMLYHVADVTGAVAECRRVLAPGGALLAVLNGGDDKAEIRALWRDAGQAVLGPAFDVPRWGARANLDNAPAIVGDHFASVTVDRRAGEFRFPTADPVVAWIDSLRAGTEHLFGDDEWQAVMTETARRAQGRIDRDGVFRATKESGVVVAR
jgi:SAM-dependent methyltransferase